jgi:glycosyltransferase involved in cell wall biosynthesis
MAPNFSQPSNSARDKQLTSIDQGLVDISVVVPVYKEEGNILPFLERLVPVLEKIGTYEVLFCLDPSPDNTQTRIELEIERNPNIGLLVFSRRFGQPAAIMAGIHHSRGKACVIIDIDLQDPPELIADMYQKFRVGYDVVYAKRRSRQGETLIKLSISWLGYKVINAVTDVRIPRNTGDFRIMSRRVVDQLRELRESHGFLRGLVAFVGFKQTYVEYDRASRVAGESNYNRYFGSFKIGLNGLVGFSNFLLSATLISGIAIAFLAFVLAVLIVATRIAGVIYPVGVPTIIVLVLFLGGVQLVSIGILGEYIGRIYDEVKNRPNFIVDRTINVMPTKIPPKAVD